MEARGISGGPSELPVFAPKQKPDLFSESSGWPLLDRVALALCWAAGITLCLLTAAIVIYMLVRGLQFLRPGELFSHPRAEIDQSRSGGFLDPLLGTFLLTLLGTLIAVPIGVATAVWLAEYARPFWLARAVESGVEIVAGTPSIVLAIFGLIVFSQGLFGFLSFKAEGGAVFGRSFLTAGAMTSLIALPLVVGATREALQAIPAHVREASYALGKTKAATIRRVLLPAARPGIATGTALGMGRIAGDTAIVVILLGASLQITGAGGLEPFDTLRGTGSTLTSYVYANSPAGEGNAPEKAYAAAFVLLTIVVALNFAVDMLTRARKASPWNL
jgi:phosphate transport system permease protein